MHKNWVIAVALVIAAPSASAAAGVVEFTADTEFVTRKGCAFVTITHRNTGRATMYFQPIAPLINVIGPGHRRLPFIGISPYLPPLTTDTATKLQPGETLVQEISLRSDYGVARAGRYTIEAYLGYYDPLRDELANHSVGRGATRRTFYFAGKCHGKAWSRGQQIHASRLVAIP